ncbi:MAG: shikimate dehydrogenase, partial [Gammaproteobacteria bacterium]|nr:shikimate dehydrogenase [Gammaproteobacteria bacterium]
MAKKPSILIGLIGSGIGKSLTPPMHEHEGEKQGMRYVYRIIDLEQLRLGVADLPDLLLAAERLGFNGLNITHPCKQAVVELLDELSEVAAKIGAVNTVMFSGGRRIGHNTDALGFFESFKEEIAATCRHDKILLLGVGGAGTAVAHTLLSQTDCRLEIFDVDAARGNSVVEYLREAYGTDRAAVADSVADSLARSDGVINATPVGMSHHPGCPLDSKLLRPALWVADVVYVPMETELMQAAS